MTSRSAIGPDAKRGNKSPLVRVMDFIGSVPFGISLMVLILAWCWIGSAGTAPFSEWFIRQTFEKTEMEWFSWWPFDLLLALLTVSLVLVTIRRIKFNLPNLGVWVIHSGVIVLMLGGAIYFGSKIEGEMAVYRRRAVLQAGDGPKQFLTLQDGAQATVQGGGRAYRVSVAMLNPSYELLTGNDKGRRTYAVQLMVQPLDGSARPFIRQLLAGYPEYTEDVVPGQGRAIKVLGRKLVDDGFTAGLDYAPANRIFLHDHAALDARVAGSDEWTEYPLRGLPRYHEYVSAPGEAWVQPGEPAIPVRPLSIAPAATSPSAALAGVQFRVIGFLPFAHLEESWEPGGNEFNPYVDFTVTAGKSVVRRALLANVPGRQNVSLAEGIDATFRWLDRKEQLDALLAPGAPGVVVRVPARGIEQHIPLSDVVGREVAVKGTSYRLRGEQFYPSWSLAGTGESATMALLRVTNGTRSYMRSVVYPRVEASQDLDLSGKRLGRIDDTAIEIALENVVKPGLVIVGGAAGSHVLLINQGGTVLHQPVALGQTASLLDGALQVTLNALDANSRHVEKPVIVPRRERDMKSGSAYSLIKVEATHGAEKQELWLEYTHYAHPSRLGYNPRTVRFAGLPPIELLYSRETKQLPAMVALDEFKLETFPGGDRERDYISLVRFFENGRWSEPQEVHANHPTEHAGWWYFQATWDPPDPRANYAGMNYTGLGVGNRHGVGILLLGSAMTVLGTLWAFYVKPVVLRRRVRAILAAREEAAADVPTARPAPVTGIAGGGHQ